MTLSTLLNRSCTVTRRSPSASTDDYGNAISAVSTATTVCELQQIPHRSISGEPAAHPDVSDTLWLLVLPAGTAIDTDDKVTVDGLSFEVSGEPWPAWNPRTQAVSHVEVNLRRVAAATDS